MSVFEARFSGRAIGLGLSLGLLLAISGCSQTASEPQEETNIASASEEPTSVVQITIAVSSDLESAANLVADQYEADTGNQAKVVVIPRNLELSKVQELVSDNPDVDVLVISHDQVHDLAGADLLAPLDGFTKDDFVESSIEAFTAGGKLRAIPVQIETSAFICKGNLDDEDLISIDQMIIEFEPFSGNPYQFNAFRTSFGLNMLEPNPEGGFNDVPGLFPETQEYLSWLASASAKLNLVSTGTGLEALARSQDGCLLTGPYDLPRLESVGIVDYSIATSFPAVGQLPARPFVESRGLAVLSGSGELAAATQFATDYLASASFQQAVYDTTGQVSPHSKVEQTADAADFQRVAEAGQPRPGNKLLSSFWGPLGIAEAKIVSGEQAAQDAWSELASALED